jgi:phytoene dehydrogenase-like protein
MPIGQRVAFIGGGHNALIAAFYLAKGGFEPVILERREIVGGGAITEEFHPGYRGSTLAHTLGPLRPDVARDLKVEKFNCEILLPDPRVFAPALNGESLLFYDDHAKTAAGIARLSAKDASKYTEFAASLEKISNVFAQLSAITPPSINKPSPEDLWNLLKTGRGVRGLGKHGIFDLLRWGPMAVADFVAEFFETELLRAVIAARGIFGTALGPWSAGSTAVLLLRAAADANPVGSAAFCRGGLGTFTHALAESAKQAGA